MANVTKLTDRLLQVKGLDADWTTPGDLAGFAKSGIMVKSITFTPHAAGDIMIIKQGKGDQATAAAAIATTATAPEIFHVKIAADTDQRVKYFGDKGQRMYPFIDISDCTIGGATARVEFELA